MAKQLFDIGKLFDAASNVDLIRATFEQIASKELSYRGRPELTFMDVLLDSFQTACLIGTRGAIPGGDYAELLSGTKKLVAFVYSENFTIDTSILCASKAAYLVGVILKQNTRIDRFQDNPDVESWNIPNLEYGKLNKLKKTNPEAFFYYYLGVKLLNLFEDARRFTWM